MHGLSDRSAAASTWWQDRMLCHRLFAEPSWMYRPIWYPFTWYRIHSLYWLVRRILIIKIEHCCWFLWSIFAEEFRLPCSRYSVARVSAAMLSCAGIESKRGDCVPWWPLTHIRQILRLIANVDWRIMKRRSASGGIRRKTDDCRENRRTREIATLLSQYQLNRHRWRMPQIWRGEQETEGLTRNHSICSKLMMQYQRGHQLDLHIVIWLNAFWLSQTAVGSYMKASPRSKSTPNLQIGGNLFEGIQYAAILLWETCKVIEQVQ